VFAKQGMDHGWQCGTTLEPYLTKNNSKYITTKTNKIISIADIVFDQDEPFTVPTEGCLGLENT
jgi:hypothetical protein